MSDTRPAQPGDAKLGMDEAITRRDFLGSVLLASGAALLESASPAELAAAARKCSAPLSGIMNGKSASR